MTSTLSLGERIDAPRAISLVRAYRLHLITKKLREERAALLEQLGLKRVALFDDAGKPAGHQNIPKNSSGGRLPPGWTRRDAPIGSLPLS